MGNPKQTSVWPGVILVMVATAGLAATVTVAIVTLLTPQQTQGRSR